MGLIVSIRWQVRLVLVAVFGLFGISGALAQQEADRNFQPPGQLVAAPGVPEGAKLSALIRTTVIALNQANMTGNYTVLRDLASPDFQRTNSAARLAEIFGPLRKRNLDLSPIVLIAPKLVKPPAIDAKGRLRLSGFFETRPQQLIFDLLFQQVAGRWKLFGITLDVRPAPALKAGRSTGETAGETTGDAAKKKAKKPAVKAKPKVKPKN